MDFWLLCLVPASGQHWRRKRQEKRKKRDAWLSFSLAHCQGRVSVYTAGRWDFRWSYASPIKEQRNRKSHLIGRISFQETTGSFLSLSPCFHFMLFTKVTSSNVAYERGLGVDHNQRTLHRDMGILQRKPLFCTINTC